MGWTMSGEPALRAARFFLDGGQPVQGWTLGLTWNGFACPLFDFDQLGAACAALEAAGLQCGSTGVDGVLVRDPEGNESRIQPDEEGFYSFDSFTWHEAPANPFQAMGNDPHARVLAHCVLSVTERDEIWACLRTARRLTGLDVAGYLDGSCFEPWVDGMGEANDLPELKSLAAQYLGEPL